MPPAPRRPKGLRASHSARKALPIFADDTATSVTAASIEQDVLDCLELLSTAEACLPAASEEGLLALRACFNSAQNLLLAASSAPQNWSDNEATVAETSLALNVDFEETKELEAEDQCDTVDKTLITQFNVFRASPGRLLATVRCVLSRTLFLLAVYRADDEGETVSDLLDAAERTVPAHKPPAAPDSTPDINSLRAVLNASSYLAKFNKTQHNWEKEDGKLCLHATDDGEDGINTIFSFKEALKSVDDKDLVHIGVLFQRMPCLRTSVVWCDTEEEIWERVEAGSHEGVRDYELASVRLARAHLLVDSEESDPALIKSSVDLMAKSEPFLEALLSAEKSVINIGPEESETTDEASKFAIPKSRVYATLGELHLNWASLLEMLEPGDTTATNSSEDPETAQHYRKAVQMFERAIELKDHSVDADLVDELRAISRSYES